MPISISKNKTDTPIMTAPQLSVDAVSESQKTAEDFIQDDSGFQSRTPTVI